MSKRFIPHLLPLLLVLLAASPALGQGSAFTYQGRLTTGSWNICSVHPPNPCPVQARSQTASKRRS